MNDIRCGNRTDFRPHLFDELFFQLVRVRLSRLERDVSVDALSLDGMWEADDGSFRDRRVRDERAFDFGRAHAVAGHVNHVVYSTGDPVIPVLVAAASVAGKVKTGIGAEVGFFESFVLPINGSHDAGPWFRDAEHSGAGAWNLFALGIEQSWLDAKEGQGGGSRFLRDGTR